jgi:hypothetical protein
MHNRTYNLSLLCAFVDIPERCGDCVVSCMPMVTMLPSRGAPGLSVCVYEVS